MANSRTTLCRVSSLRRTSNTFLSLTPPDLKACFRMIMAMDYNDNTPSDYQAPRFHQGDEHASRLINMGHFSENHVMKTGFHRFAWRTPCKALSCCLQCEVLQLACIYQVRSSSQSRLVNILTMVTMVQAGSPITYMIPAKVRVLANILCLRSLEEDTHNQRL
jgi:hypothetical protein